MLGLIKGLIFFSIFNKLIRHDSSYHIWKFSYSMSKSLSLVRMSWRKWLDSVYLTDFFLNFFIRRIEGETGREREPLEAQECLCWGEWRRQPLFGWQAVWSSSSDPIASSDACDVGCSVVPGKVLIYSSFLSFVSRLFPQISALVVQNSCSAVHDWG